MNKQRRRVLNNAIKMLESLQDVSTNSDAKAIITDALSDVQDCAADEQFALDSRPESLMFTDATADMEDNVADLEDAVFQLDVLEADLDDDGEFDYQQIKSEITEIIDRITEAIDR